MAATTNVEPRFESPKKWADRFVLFFGGAVLSVLLRTVRFTIDDETGLFTNPGTHPPFIGCLWHNRLFCMPHLKKKYLRVRKMAVLTSPSKDGSWLAWVGGKFGMAAVRGSSSKRGVRATMELKRAVQNGWDIAITPDGPRGPRYEVHPGAILLSQVTGAPIHICTVEYDRCWRLGRWDGLMIPYPFTKARYTMKGPIHPADTVTEEAFELECKRLGEALMAMTGEL